MKNMILTALCMAAALGASGCERVSDEVFGARVRAYILDHPEIIEEAAMKLEEAKLVEAQRSSSMAINRHREAIERDKRDFVANPNGKITVTEFFDYRCGYCKTAAPEIIRLIAENPDVRFVFKEFPIFGGTSDQAAALTMAAHKQGDYLKLYQSFFEMKNLTPETMDLAITKAGLNPATLKAKAKDQDIMRHLGDTQRLARDLRIDGTPTFIIGDELIPGADFDALRAAIDKARKS